MPTSIWIPDWPPQQAGADDDEFADAAGAGVPTGWTEVDHGAVQTVSEDELGLKLLQSTHAGDQFTGIYKAIPTGPFTIWTKMSISGLAETNYIMGGLALWQDATSSSGDLYNLRVQCDATSVSFNVERWSSYTTWESTVVARTFSVDAFPTHMYLRVRRDATPTYSWDVSSDGIAWAQLASATIGITPVHYGPCMDNNATGADVNVRFKFFRYLASDVGLDGLVKGDRVNMSIF